MDWKNKIYIAYEQHLDAESPNNPELIDVQNRFRLIDVDGQAYVVKKSKPMHAEKEQSFAIEAANRLNGCTVDALLLQVVVPEVILCGDVAYLITPYLGKTLQSIRYMQDAPVIQQETVHRILQVFKDSGIQYRGFLPRNIILANGVLYLIDWEDVTFFDMGIDVPSNLKSETNFVLNWMYNYDAEEIRTLYHQVYQSFSEQNTPLDQYETILCHLCGQPTNSVQIARSFVETLVLAAEAPCKSMQNNNIILPTDCASVIADIFTPHIDAFFDILCAYVRQSDETGYVQWLNFLGSYIRDNQNTETQTRGQIFSILLMMCLSPNQAFSLATDEDSGWTLSKMQFQSERLPLINAYLRSDSDQLKLELWMVLKQITGNCAIQEEADAHALVTEILSLSEGRHSLGKLVWENTFYRFIRTGKTASIPGSYVLLRKNKSKDFTEAETICYAKSVQMLRLFLASQGVPISGIYTQSARDGTLNTMILPYHISVLQSLSIPLDEYQPYIELYLDYYSNKHNTEFLCESFDSTFKSFAATYKERVINAH